MLVKEKLLICTSKKQLFDITELKKNPIKQTSFKNSNHYNDTNEKTNIIIYHKAAVCLFEGNFYTIS